MKENVTFYITQKPQKCERIQGSVLIRERTVVERDVWGQKVTKKLPTYIIERTGEKEYTVQGAGIFPELVTTASLTRLRAMCDLLGYEHMVAETEDFKKWLHL